MARGNAIRRNFPGMVRGCSRCGSEITVTEQMCKYSKYVCSPCQSAKAADYVRRNREKKRQWNNAYHSRISDKRAEATKAWRDRHPEKKAAHQAVQSAIRNGTLVRQPCVICGDPKTHAHHDDYSRQLDVVWLCHKHHMQRHAMLAARGGDRD